jgi:hypothetical protein
VVEPSVRSTRGYQLMVWGTRIWPVALVLGFLSMAINDDLRTVLAAPAGVAVVLSSVLFVTGMVLLLAAGHVSILDRTGQKTLVNMVLRDAFGFPGRGR